MDLTLIDFCSKFMQDLHIKSNVLTYSDEKIPKLFIWCETVKDTHNNTFIYKMKSTFIAGTHSTQNAAAAACCYLHI